MWRELVQRYAIRAREFSDTVAALGRQAHPGSEASRKLLEEIRTRRDLCNEVANEIGRYLKDAAAVDGTAVRTVRTVRSPGGVSNPSDSNSG
jgi:hypothetical protein